MDSLVGSSDDNERLLEAAKAGESALWKVPKKSHANDPAIVYLNRGFAARCVIAEDPYQRERLSAYLSDIRDIVLLASPVPLAFVQKNHPTWKWLTAYTKHYTTIHDAAIQAQLDKLLNEYQASFAEPLVEGTAKSASVTRYERNPLARQQCIWHYGAVCHVCRFSFGETYGETAQGYIHVHHLKPMASGRGERAVDPIKDLRPICPNCHAVAHRQSPPLSIAELKRMLKQAQSRD